MEISSEEQQVKEHAKSIVVELVKQFKEDIVVTGRIKDYNEESVKQHFITPLFKALGWNTSNQNEVFYEENINGKRADYLFKLNNKEIFVVEAKAPHVTLKIGSLQGDKVATQAINYAWHRNVNFAVITDFEELSVFHALERPKTINRNLARHKDFGVLSLNYQDFEKEFDKLWILSKHSVENGVLDACLGEKDKKLKTTVDEVFLGDLKLFREWLVKDVKSKNTPLSTDQINEVVQKWINRLIFIRTTEDRGLENNKLLLSLASNAKLQKLKNHLKVELLSVFREFDDKYNSKLFAHIDLDDQTLILSQDVLIKVIYGLYFGTGGDRIYEYDFSLIPTDLLGRIYEQYLGILLQTTEKRAKLVDAKSKRKKMGIYYTPSYIVDYIVRNTIGEALKDKSLEEISSFTIVDPACGSGSFLLRAFDEVCKFVKERIEKGDSYDIFDKKYLVKGKLSLGQKIKIIMNNIYGVDLDEQAIEICRLSLLLKLLEGEGPETKKRLLPTLNNIQCGNSLIDDESIARDKAFKWKYRFSDVFKQGGFDVVVGNPPYVEFKRLEKSIKNVLEKVYVSTSGKYDLFVPFIERSLSILQKEGLCSFIVPAMFAMRDFGQKIREYISKNSNVKELVYFSDFQVFSGVTNYPMIFVFKKGNVSKTKISIFKNASKLTVFQVSTYLNQLKSDTFFSSYLVNSDSFDKEVWEFFPNVALKIKSKLEQLASVKRLKDISKYIFVGIQTGKDEVFLISESDKDALRLEEDIVLPILRGRDVQKYSLNWSGTHVIFPYNKLTNKVLTEAALEETYPKVYKYLKENRNKLKGREYFDQSTKKWYELWCERVFSKFQQDKIICAEISPENRFCLDTNKFLGNTKTFSTVLDDEHIGLTKYVLAILNSKLMNFYHKLISVPKAGGCYEYKTQFLGQYPILIQPTQSASYIILTKLADQMLTLNKRLQEAKTEHEKEQIKQQIASTDAEIDEKVYKLYDLTDKEIDIIEESFK